MAVTATRRRRTSARRRPAAYHHGALREALVAAAMRILEEHGLEQLTLRECARRAGVSHGAPAHHFRDVTGLLTEVAASGFDSLAASMREKASAAGASPMARLREVGVAYIEFAVANPALFQLMFRSDRIDAASAHLKAAANETFGVLQGSLRAAREREGEPDAHAAAQALLAWSAVHGFATLLLEGQLARFQGTVATRHFARTMGEKMLGLLRAAFAP